MTTVTSVLRPGFRQALRSRTFGLLLLAHGSGTIAQGVVTLAVGVAVHERTGSGVWTSVTVALAFAPYAVFSSLAGVLADRNSRSTVLAICCGVRAGLGSVVAAALLFDAPVAVLVALTAAMAVCATPSFPALAAATRQCVSDADLPAANALATSVENVTWIAAPGVFGVLTMADLDSWGVVTCSAVLLVLAAALAAGVRLPRPRRVDVPAWWRDLEAGVAAVALNASLRRPMMLAVLDNFLYGFLIVAVVLLAGESGNGDLGRLNAALAIGALVATVVVNRVTTHGRVRIMPLVMVLGFSGCLALLGATGAGQFAVLLVAAAGASTLVAEVAAVTLLQRAADDCALARVFGVYDQVNVGAIAAGSFLAGPLAAALGARGALMAAAATGTVLALTALVPTAGSRQARAATRVPTQERRRVPAVAAHRGTAHGSPPAVHRPHHGGTVTPYATSIATLDQGAAERLDSRQRSDR